MTLSAVMGGQTMCPSKERPNAGAHLLPEAEARHERRLEAVRCSARLCQNPLLKVLLSFRHPLACTGTLPRPS